MRDISLQVFDDEIVDQLVKDDARTSGEGTTRYGACVVILSIILLFICCSFLRYVYSVTTFCMYCFYLLLTSNVTSNARYYNLEQDNISDLLLSFL